MIIRFWSQANYINALWEFALGNKLIDWISKDARKFLNYGTGIFRHYCLIGNIDLPCVIAPPDEDEMVNYKQYSNWGNDDGVHWKCKETGKCHDWKIKKKKRVIESKKMNWILEPGICVYKYLFILFIFGAIKTVMYEILTLFNCVSFVNTKCFYLKESTVRI